MNAFQVYTNEDPFLMCTAMTHTRHKTNTKANTCYTGGVKFLEKGDEIYVRDLEPERFSILLPSHTFMGAIQLSSAK